MQRRCELGEVRQIEQHPADHSEEHGVEPLHCRRQPLQNAAQEKLFQQQKHRIVQAPEHEIPLGAVPQARERPDHQDVQHPPAPPDPVAAQRDVDIVPEPGGQADVPAPPELGDGAREVGIVEVLQKVEPKDPAQADGHVRVAGEVEINLQGIAHRPQPVGRGAQALGAGGIDQLGQLRHVVGQQHLLGQPHDKPPGAVDRVIPVLTAVPDLLLHRLIAHDRSGDELRKKAHIEREVKEVPLHAHLAAVEVNDIGEDLKGVKADADGQRDGANGDMKAQKAIDIVHQKPQVFEHHEVSQQQRDARGQHQLFNSRPGAEALDQKARQPGGQRGGHHDNHIPRLSPGVEQQRAHQQHAVAPRTAFDGKVQQNHQREKEI